MRIAYVTTYDARSPVHWSGTGYSMWNALKGDGVQVDLIGPLDEPLALVWKGKTWLYRNLLRSNYQRARQPWLQRQFARQIETRLAGGHYDVVVSPGTIPIAYLDTPIPVVFWTDATFDGVVPFYKERVRRGRRPAFDNLSPETLRDGHAAEQAALDRCSIAIFSSEWAAGTALQYYGVDPSKVRVVPFGPNLQREISSAEVELAVAGRSMDECRLAFVAMEWSRKGGDIAIDVTRELIGRGINATLTVVGVAPPTGAPPFVQYAGFIDKRKPQELDRYAAILKDSHFLLLPSWPESAGIVFAEASAFGVPSCAIRVCGVPTMVRDGLNGQLFDRDSRPSDWADYIEALMIDQDAYRSLARSTHAEYSTRLNWRVAGETVRAMLSGLA